jgi:TANFOR domain-containing protein
MLKKVIALLLTVMVNIKLEAQIYPSIVTTNLLPPYSIFIDEYANPLTPKIKATIVFTDFTEPSWNAYLKLKITGSNFAIESKPGAKPPQAINVIPGVPFTISGADLDWYFNNNNLNFSGITRAQLESNNNRLPEGFYTFCFEVIDYVTNKKISLPNCASAYLSLNDPPMVIAPACGNAIENLTQQNILFQWQISNTNGNLNVSSLNYQIDLYEVNKGAFSPQNAIVNNQALPIWQSQPISQNSYLYGPAEPPLEKGKSYVFTVKTIEQSKSQIKNNGYSQACWFNYGYPEGGVIELKALPNDYQLGSKDDGYFSWSKPNNTINKTQMIGYQFRIVPLLADQDKETAILNNIPFFEADIPASTSEPKNFALPTKDMMRLQKMTPYVWQVKGFSGQQEIAKSPIFKFTGSAVIEKFLAGGFEVAVTNLTSFDTITYKISGKGKIILNGIGEAPEFSFNDIYLNPIGNNTWVMVKGEIRDQIVLTPYTLLPDSVLANKNAQYAVDSILITTQKLLLGGFISWKFPLGITGKNVPFINSKRQILILSNNFKLQSEDINTLKEDNELHLLEPGGFTMHLDENSEVYVKESKYNLKLNGFIELPESVKDGINTRVKIPFNKVDQLFFIKQKNVYTAEGIRLVNNTSMDLKPIDYVFDFSESVSEGDYATDPMWKGFYMTKASLIMPINAEKTGQITASGTLSSDIINNTDDSTTMFVNQRGLTFNTSVDYNPQTDTLKFNTFTTVDNKFKISITDNLVYLSHLTGKIQVPVLDTAGAFPYFIKIDEFGFGKGYLINALNNYAFTFNGNGGEEQKININLTRAVFKNNNKLEMDMNLTWPHFNLNLNQLQKFCAWGNGNIGFETPNGILPLTYQATGRASNYDIQVDRVGCGRVANLYSFGISARIIMADDISGENGAPIVNSYSIYKNPLLNGDFTTIDFSMSNDTLATNSNSSSNVSVAEKNLVIGIGQTLNDLGVGTSSITGTFVSNDKNENGALLPASVLIDMKKVVRLAEVFAEFTDSPPKVMDYITLAKLILNDDNVEKLVNKSPKQIANLLIQGAADVVIKKINQPILKISDEATVKIRTSINTKIVEPVTGKVDTLLTNFFKNINDNLLSAANNMGDKEPEAIKQSITYIVNTVKNNLVNEIKNSINNSVEKNVTSKITGFIEVGVTGKITGFVRNEVKTIATDIIESGVNKSVDLNNIVQNAGILFKSVGDTIADAIQTINFNTIKNTTENIADDIVKNIDFKKIGEDILAECAAKGMDVAVKNILKNQLDNIGVDGAAVANVLLSSVKFDFTNVGDKIKNGQLDKIVKFDFTNIYIQTKAADVRGKLAFVKDDPTYGDSFQAMVAVKIKVPKEDRPIAGTLKFINGKTSQADKFAYWFFSGKLMGLSLPLGSIPFTVDGFEGSVYHKMKNRGNAAPLPDLSVNYGIRAGMYLFDTPSKGKIIKFDVGLGVEFGAGNFAIQLDGDALIGNIKSFSVATAKGYLGYYSAEKRFQGVFNVKFNTAPLLCAGGEMGVKVDGVNHTWEIYVGKKITPIEIKLLCKDNLKAGAYFSIEKNALDAGFLIDVSVEAQSPWIGKNSKVRGWANFGFGIDAYTNLSFEPSFKINDAYISAWANAAVGFDYDIKGVEGKKTIAGVSLSGILLYKNHERAEIHGEMNGTVTLLDCDFNVNMEVHYDLDNKRKIEG